MLLPCMGDMRENDGRSTGANDQMTVFRGGVASHNGLLICPLNTLSTKRRELRE